MQLHEMTFMILGLFILYRIYLRVRRSIGWQRFNPARMRVSLGFLSVVGSLFFVVGALHTISLISNVVGILLGAALASYGAAMTRFEERDGSWFYRPNTWIGSLLTVIFFGRLFYRIYASYSTLSPGSPPQQLPLTERMHTTFNTWTSGLMLIVFAYYVVYYILMLRKQHRA